MKYPFPFNLLISLHWSFAFLKWSLVLSYHVSCLICPSIPPVVLVVTSRTSWKYRNPSFSNSDLHDFDFLLHAAVAVLLEIIMIFFIHGRLCNILSTLLQIVLSLLKSIFEHMFIDPFLPLILQEDNSDSWNTVPDFKGSYSPWGDTSIPRENWEIRK